MKQSAIPGLMRGRDSTRRAVLTLAQMLERADAILAAPPHGHIARTAGRGELLARAALPLDLLPTTNATRHVQPWAAAKLKKRIAGAMLAQIGRRAEPIAGRAFVRLIRFSSVEPDQLNDGFKAALDAVVKLGWLVDDAPRYVEIASWWERAPRGEGFGILEVWS